MDTVLGSWKVKSYSPKAKPFCTWMPRHVPLSTAGVELEHVAEHAWMMLPVDASLHVRVALSHV